MLVTGCLAGCGTQPVPRVDWAVMLPDALSVADETVRTRFPPADLTEFTRTHETDGRTLTVRYERQFTLVATPEEPSTRVIQDLLWVRMSGTNVLSASRSQQEVYRIPPSRDDI